MNCKFCDDDKVDVTLLYSNGDSEYVCFNCWSNQYEDEGEYNETDE